MRMKILFWIIAMISSIQIAFAQTGLFTPTGGNAFIAFGITILVVFIILEAIRRQFKKGK